jgi:hypothetical protein
MLAFLAAQAVAPNPAELRSFGDWIVGCDNGRACQAVALVTYEDDDIGSTMTLRREAGGEAEPIFWINNGEARGGSLAADGQRLPVRLIAREDSAMVHPADTRAFVDAIRAAHQLRLRDASGTDLGPISVEGASAAMLYMDEQQRRLDTVTALVRRGTRPASAVPAPPTLPEVRAAPIDDTTTLTFTDAQIAGLRREAGCTLDEVGAPDSYEAAPLASGQTLVLLACGSGAYNVTYLPYIAQSRDGRIRFTAAPFDYQWAMRELERPSLINAEWDHQRHLLSEFYRGRGIGDCGTKATYAWDGSRFRLVEQQDMEQCQGTADFITTWRARVVRP